MPETTPKPPASDAPRISVGRALLAWAAATLACAAIDIAYNIVLWDLILHRLTSERLLRYIASGVLGPAAFSDGASVVVLGLAMHCGISASWSAVFVVAYTRLAWVRARPTVSGLVLGVIAFVVMTYVVVPLSAVTRSSAGTWWSISLNFGTHLLFVGLPIAPTARAVFRRGARAAAAVYRAPG